MSAVEGLTPEEEKFFETRGEAAPPEEAADSSSTETAASPAPDAAVKTDVKPDAAAPAPDKTPPAPDAAKLTELYENTKRALSEQRFQQKALKDEIERERQRAAKLEETFQKFVSRVVDKPVPAFEEDPAGHLRHQVDDIKKALTEQSDVVRQQQQQQTAAQQFEQFRNAVVAQEAQFVKTTPDYQAALDHFRELRTQDLADLGVDPNEIAQAIQREQLTIAANAIRAGKNPAEVAYGIAKRYGYAPKAAAAPKPAADTAKEKIENIAKGQEASKTLPSGGGEGDITLEALANLSEDQIDALVQNEAWWKKNISAHRGRR